MKSIVVLANKSSSPRLIINKAIQLASPYNAHIDLVYYGKTSSYFHWINKQEATYLAMSQRKSIHFTIQDLEQSSIADWIEKQSHNKEQHDIIVKHGLSHEAYSHRKNDWALFQKSPYPVYMIASDQKAHRSNILVALDLTAQLTEKRALNKQAVLEGQRLAETLSSDLHYCYVRHGNDNYHLSARLQIEKLNSIEMKNLNALIHENPINDGHIHLLEGIPYQGISYLARKLDVQCITIGYSSKTALDNKIIGSTAEQTQHVSQKDILVINHRTIPLLGYTKEQRESVIDRAYTA